MHTRNHIPNLKPFVKWVGGKSKVVDKLLPFIPENISTYVEPFVGSGAMLFSLNFTHAIINDTNTELINTYKVIRDNLDELIAQLSKLSYSREEFMKIRAWDQDPNFLTTYTEVQRAARFIYLLKTCFNGLYRVNSSNYFNTPFGKYTNPTICDIPTLRACSKYLQDKSIKIYNTDYYSLLDKIPEGSFVYLDPPYYPVSHTANFVSYSSTKFNEVEHYRVSEFCHDLNAYGIRFMLSNSDTPDTRRLYRDFNIDTIQVGRPINSDATRRGSVSEIVVTNYDPTTGELN